VLGEAAAAGCSAQTPSGVRKVNEQWFQVIGIAGPQLTVQTEVGGLPAQDRNNIIYVPLYSAIFRLEDGQTRQKDEIDGIYLPVASRTRYPRRRAAPRALTSPTAARGISRSSPRPSSSPSSAARSASSRW
jgi:hypothetical protein